MSVAVSGNTSFYKICIAVFCCLGLGFAQKHFTFTATTGNNMTVIIPKSINPQIQGAVMEKGDEIGVFSSAGLCVGAVVWNDVNCAITVWGDNDMTPAIDGMIAGDTLRFRVWDTTAYLELQATAVCSTGKKIYAVNGITLLKRLFSAPAVPILVSPDSGATGVSITPTLSWNTTSGAVTYTLQVSKKTDFTTLIFDQAALTDTIFPIVSALEKAVMYYWRVSAKNSGGESDWSCVWNFTTESGTPVIIQNPAVLVGVWLSRNLLHYAMDDAVFFYAKTQRYVQITVSIFDALGNCVYKSKKYDISPKKEPVNFGSWDMRGSSNFRKAPPGVYVAVFTIADGAGRTQVKHTIGIKK
jgi:hypothetical protein